MDRLKKALRFFTEAAASLSSLQDEMKQKETALIQADTNLSIILDKITHATTQAERKRSEMLGQRDDLVRMKDGLQEEYGKAQVQLSLVEPTLQRATDSLALIQPKDSPNCQYKVRRL